MTIRYIDSNDKYVQYRLMADTFSIDVTQWQGVDNVLTPGSKNLVQSGEVFNDVNTLHAQNVRLTDRLYGIEESVIDLEDVENKAGFIFDEVYRTSPTGSYTHKIVEVQAGKKIRITANADYNGRYAFLKSYPSVIVNDITPVDYCDGETRRAVTKNTSVETFVPDDCVYMYILVKREGVLVEVTSIEYLAVDGDIPTIESDVTDIKGDITDIKGNITDIKGNITDVAVQTIGSEIDFDSLDTINKFIDSSLTWHKSSLTYNYKCKIVPIEEIAYISVALKNNQPTTIVFLGSYPDFTQAPDIVDGQRHRVSSDQILVIPNGCNYIYTLVSNDDVDVTPSVVMYGVLAEIINDTHNKVEEHEQIINDIVHGVNLDEDLTKYVSTHLYINSSGVVKSNYGYSSVLIPANCDRIQVIPKTGEEATISFLTDNELTVDEQAPLCAETEARYKTTEATTYNISSDCNYIYVLTVASTTDVTPTVKKITESLNEIKSSIKDISEDVEDISEDVEEIKREIEPLNRHLKICILGNSYSADCWRYVPFMLLNYGITCEIYFYYRGSGSLNDLNSQWEDYATSGMAESDGREHTRFCAHLDTRINDKWINYPKTTDGNDNEILTMCAKDIVEVGNTIGGYDIVTLQQQSSFTDVDPDNDSNGRYTNLGNIIDYLQEHLDNPFALGWFQSYTRASHDSETIREDSLANQKKLFEEYPFSLVLPVATAVFSARGNQTLAALGSSQYANMWGSDNVHLQDGLPCYIGSLVVIQTLFNYFGYGKSVLNDIFRATDDVVGSGKIGLDATIQGPCVGVTEANCRLAQKAAILAVRKPSVISVI